MKVAPVVHEIADSTRYSQAVPHPSTNRALSRLTSECKWDPYGRQRRATHKHALYQLLKLTRRKQTTNKTTRKASNQKTSEHNNNKQNRTRTGEQKEKAHDERGQHGQKLNTRSRHKQRNTAFASTLKPKLPRMPRLARSAKALERYRNVLWAKPPRARAAGLVRLCLNLRRLKFAAETAGAGDPERLDSEPQALAADRALLRAQVRG